MKKILSILTVLGKDRPGIIARVTGSLFRHGCNLEDISMTVLEGEFAMIMVVCLGTHAKAKLQAEFLLLQRRGELDFFWKDWKGKPTRHQTPSPNGRTYLIRAIGADRTGIVYKMSRLLAQKEINITDLNSRIVGTGKKTVYAMVLEADIPKKINIQKLQLALQGLARTLKIEISLSPFEKIEF